MAKYIVKYGSETATNEGRPAEYATREEAATALIYAVSNALLCTHIDPAKFRIEEVPDEPKDVPDLIPDYKAACAYLDGVGWPSTKDIDVRESVFAKLLTLCKAWNRADNWEPDRDDEPGKKYFPFYDDITPSGISVESDTWRRRSPFVFPTVERARQFGERFIDLFKQLYGIREGE